MSITKVNTYLTDRNITNMSLNVDYNRLGEDKTQITVNYGTTPATVTIKNGSIIECNGNRYLIDADYSFQMANAAHNYLTFTDSPAIAFSSAAAIGTFDSEKQGYYQADNLTRTLKFYIDQSGDSEFVLIDCVIPDVPMTTKRFDKIKVHTNSNKVGKVIFDVIDYDEAGNFDLANSRFVCNESGQFLIITQRASNNQNIIYKNGASTGFYDTGYFGGDTFIFDLTKGDYIEIYVNSGSWSLNSRLYIFRLL